MYINIKKEDGIDVMIESKQKIINHETEQNKLKEEDRRTNIEEEEGKRKKKRMQDEWLMPGRNVQVHYIHSDILTQSERPL